MDIDSIALLLAQKFPALMLVLSILGSLVVSAQALVSLTPGKGDDAVLEKLKSKPLVGKIIEALIKFAVIQKK